MNYLGHLYFSTPTPLSWAGSLMGDFVKGMIPQALPAELKQHLQLHRRLDTYTTESHFFQTSRRRLDPRFRYARGILVDVFYDHFLACSWLHYSPLPLADFAQRVYLGLQSCFDLLPVALQQQLPHMIEHDWLTSYQDPDVIFRVLWRLEIRLRHRFPLAEGISELHHCRTALEKDFTQFMREVSGEFMVWRQQIVCASCQQNGSGDE